MNKEKVKAEKPVSPVSIELKEHLELGGKPAVDPQELMKKIVFRPTALVWKNFHVDPPAPGRWFVMWCNLGPIAQNLYLSYRDNLGNYDLPHPTKAYPIQAYAYIDYPEVDQAVMKKLEEEAQALNAKPSPLPVAQHA